MSSDELHISFSSISLAPTNIFRPDQILVPACVTRGIVQRAVSMRNVLAPIFGKANIGVSLHPARVVDVPLIGKLFQEQQIQISSVDIPDVVTFRNEVKNMMHDIFRADGMFFNRVGWMLQNVASYNALEQKLLQALSLLENSESALVLRGNAKYWHDRTKIVLATLRRQYPNVSVAIEIDPPSQTPNEYITFLHMLRKTDLYIYADVDMGHLAESNYIHRDRIENSSLTSILATLFSQTKEENVVGVVTLNQYVNGNEETHTNLLTGPVNLFTAMKFLGEAVRKKTLHFPPTIIVESNPRDYQTILGEKGLDFFQKIKQSFDEGKAGR